MPCTIDEYLRCEEIDPTLPIDTYKPVASYDGNGNRRNPPGDIGLGEFEEEDDE